MSDGFIITGAGVLAQYVGKAVHVRIPNNVTRIADGAFYNRNVASVIIPGNVKIIGKQAFRDCKKLTDVTVEEGCIEIDDYAFWTKELPTVRRFTLPASLKKIGKYVFYPQEYEYKLDSVDEILQKTGFSNRYYCEIKTPYNPVIIQYAIPYQDMSVAVLASEQEALAELDTWIAAETAQQKQNLATAEGWLAKANARVSALRKDLWDARDVLDGMKGFFKKKEREAQEKKVQTILQNLEKAQLEIPKYERNVAREKENLEKFQAESRELKLIRCRDWIGAKKTASAKAVLFRARDEHIEKRLERERAEETRLNQAEKPRWYVPIVDDTPLPSSGYTLPDHGPLATAKNCGMPPIDVSDV